MSTVIFLCVANSARSQMAEGLARAEGPTGWSFFSAGTEPKLVNPLAERALREVGIDISHHRSKGLEEVPLEEADLVVTLCAEESCPVLPPGTRRLHWPLSDPAAVTGSVEEQMEGFRTVRDQLRSKLASLWREVESSGGIEAG